MPTRCERCGENWSGSHRCECEHVGRFIDTVDGHAHFECASCGRHMRSAREAVEHTAASRRRRRSTAPAIAETSKPYTAVDRGNGPGED